MKKLTPALQVLVDQKVRENADKIINTVIKKNADRILAGLNEYLQSDEFKRKLLATAKLEIDDRIENENLDSILTPANYRKFIVNFQDTVARILGVK
jgi:hypothetical protein